MLHELINLIQGHPCRSHGIIPGMMKLLHKLRTEIDERPARAGRFLR